MKLSKWIKQKVEDHGPHFLLAPYMKWRYRLRDASIQGSHSERFARIYQTNKWGDAESRSGSGSNTRAAARLIEAIPALLDQYPIHTFVDIPCGDFHWMQLVDLRGRKYVGGDIVQELIEENQRRYASPERSFICIDLTKDALPAGDLLLVRDCIIHLSFEMIHAALANIKRSAITYLLATVHPHKRRNWDIETGGFRPINLLKPPFNLPKPLKMIEEDGEEIRDLDYRRHLALWRVADL